MNYSLISALREEKCLGGEYLEPRLSLEFRSVDAVTVISCTGRMVYGNEVGMLFDDLVGMLLPAGQVIIDLSGVETIDASGVGQLAVLAETAQARQCSIKLATPSDYVQQVLALTSLTSVFEVYSTLDAATLACNGHLA